MRIYSEKLKWQGIVLAFLLGFAGCDNGKETVSAPSVGKNAVEYWLTTADKSVLFSKAASALEFDQRQEPAVVINVDTSRTYQTIDGFGYSLTGGSAWLINRKLSQQKRKALLQELFGTDGNSIGVSYLRVSIGASDLDERVFSYNDMAEGRKDPSQDAFSIEPDRRDLIPVLKEILAISPGLKIMGSPWSAPAWMKTNNSPKGGSLKPEYYRAFALYFVKYIKAMEKEGITIDAITIQNEPENPKNNPSMVMTAGEQAIFVRDHLGPLFEKTGIKTRIVVFDHNCDHPEYPIAVMNDPAAKKYIDGSAFHLYLGDISALSKVYDAHPDRNVYFTEQWTSPQGTFDGDMKWHTKHLTIGATRNWSRNVLEWNLAADPQFNPHTDEGGCTMCLGALTIDGDSYTRNVSYYIIAHASKLVRPGSVRILSNETDGLPNVAFQRPDGKKVLIVLNESDTEKEFGIGWAGRTAVAKLPAGAVATYIW